FFFSSRRRHTRFSRDWSSDVCSSDLVSELLDVGAVVVDHHEGLREQAARLRLLDEGDEVGAPYAREDHVGLVCLELRDLARELRSEERRVGKECGSGWWAHE